MKKILKIIIVLLVIFFDVSAQRKIYKGPYNTRYGHFSYRNKTTNAEYEYIEDAKGNRIYDGYFKFNAKMSTYKKYSEDIILVNGRYSKNLKDGKWTYKIVRNYSDFNNVIYEVNYTKGILNGKSKLNVNDKYFYEISFKDNHYIGKFEFVSENIKTIGEFDENGFLKNKIIQYENFNGFKKSRTLDFTEFGILNYIIDKDFSNGKIDTIYINEINKKFEQSKEYSEMYDAYKIENNWYFIKKSNLRDVNIYYQYNRLNDDKIYFQYSTREWGLDNIIGDLYTIIQNDNYGETNKLFIKEFEYCNEYVELINNAIEDENNNELEYSFINYYKSKIYRENNFVNNKLNDVINQMLSTIENSQSNFDLDLVKANLYIDVLWHKTLESQNSLDENARNDTSVLNREQLNKLIYLTEKSKKVNSDYEKYIALIYESNNYIDRNNYNDAIVLLEEAYQINKSFDLLSKIDSLKILELIKLSDYEMVNGNYFEALKKLKEALKIKQSNELLLKIKEVQKILDFIQERKFKYYKRENYDKLNYQNKIKEIESNLKEYLYKNFNGDINAKILITIDTNGINKFEIHDALQAKINYEKLLDVCNKTKFGVLFIKGYSVNTKDTFLFTMKTIKSEMIIERKLDSNLDEYKNSVIYKINNNKYLNMPNGLLKLDVYNKIINQNENILYQPKSFKYYGKPSNAFLSLMIPGLGNSRVGLENGLEVGTIVYSTIALGIGAKYLSNYYADKYINASTNEDKDHYYSLQNGTNYAFYGLVGLGLLTWSVNIYEVASKGYENKRSSNEFKKSINLTYLPTNNSFKLTTTF